MAIFHYLMNETSKKRNTIREVFLSNKGVLSQRSVLLSY